MKRPLLLAAVAIATACSVTTTRNPPPPDASLACSPGGCPVGAPCLHSADCKSDHCVDNSCAAWPDAGASDLATREDASVPPDASVLPDASALLDATTPPDLAARSDATLVIPVDASVPADQSVLPDTASNVFGKRVFVSSVGFDGNFGGVTGADAQCQKLADAAQLGGTYKAWLSGSTLATSPSARFTHAALPYVMVDGTPIANDWTDLTKGTIAHNINLTEKGSPYTGDYLVYTHTLTNGTPGLTVSNDTCYGAGCSCSDWTVNAATGNPDPGSAVGRADVSTAQWTDYSFANLCNGLFSIYCFEQ